MFVVVKNDIQNKNVEVIHVEEEQDEVLNIYLLAYDEMINDIEKIKESLTSYCVSYVDKYRTEVYKRDEGFFYNGNKQLMYVYQIIKYDDNEYEDDEKK